jgi:hypothetical protein
MKRNEAFDALKLWLTILVIFHHTAVTYGAVGGWYYREVMPNASLSSKLLVYFCTINQAYFMGFFFLIAGYFTLPSLQKKGDWGFIKDKIIHLGLPLLIYGYGLGLITIAIALTAKDKPFLETLFKLYSNGVFEIGPLWFVKALLVFSLITLLAERFFKVSEQSIKAFPTHKTLLAWALVCGLTAFIIRLYVPVGFEIWNFQLGYFPMYIMLFITGLLTAKNKWLENIPQDVAQTWRRIALYTLPTIIPLGFFFQGNPTGGMNFPALFYALWEPFIAWGAILGLLVYANKRTSFHPTLARFAYGVFIIHPLIVVSVSVVMKDFAFPALIKFMITGTISTLICFVFVWLVIKIPFMKRVI